MLDNELINARYQRWKIHLPGRDFHFRIEDWVPAMAGTIGKIVMVAAVAGMFAAEFGLGPEFVAENVRYELLIVALFAVLFCGILLPNANLPGTHGPMLPLIPLVVASGGHPLALGIAVGVLGLMLSLFKGGSRLLNLTGVGVRAGLLLYLGAVGLISQMSAFQAWAEASGNGLAFFGVILVTIVIYAVLARVQLRWLAIPLCSVVAGVMALMLGADFEFKTEPGLPHLSPFYWWGEDTGWQLGWPELSHFVAVLPFAILAVAMWSPDFVGHRVFQEMNYPKKAKGALMNVDDTMTVCSVRQIVGSTLCGGNLTSSWGTYIIPAAIAKRPIPGGAMLTGLLCVVCALWGYPMDLAMWEPVLRVALIVGVFLPLLEAGMTMVKEVKTSQVAGICLFSCAFVNPVFGWAATMLMDNSGVIGDRDRSSSLTSADRVWLPLATLSLCVVALASVGQLPGIPALL